MTRDKLALWVAAIIIVLWVVGVIVAALDGNELLKLTVGPFGIVVGWVFAKAATAA